MAKTSVEVDRELARRAADILGTRTLRETIHASMHEVVQSGRRLELIDILREEDRLDPDAAEQAWGGHESLCRWILSHPPSTTIAGRTGGERLPIPAFEPSGFLPAGRHVASPAEFHASLVAPFPSSVRRPAIHGWWERHLASLRWLTHVTRQWIGGSFVSEKPEPADIDVCTFLDGSSIDGLPHEKQDVISFMTSGKVAQGFWHCDSYPVLEYPPTHPNHAAYLAAATYWHQWWGQTRPDPSGVQIVRGYLEIA